MMPSPWGSRRSITAWAKARPIQKMPSSVTAIPPTLGRRWASVRANSTGREATAASSTWRPAHRRGRRRAAPRARSAPRGARGGRARTSQRARACRPQPSANTPSAKIRPPSITMNSANAIAGSAASTRAARSERPGGGRRALRRPAASSRLIARRRSVAAGAELREGLLEHLAGEVGPELLAEDKLGVGGLPEQVVGEAPLAARADDQVGVVHLRRVEAAAELLFGLRPEALGGVENLRAPP